MNAPLSHRREFLKTTSSGFGYLAFAALAHQQALRANPAAGPLMPKQPHFTPRAKHVIFLCMQGAPSHVDTFDYKPKLIADAGKSAPSAAGRYGTAKLMPPQWKFGQHGKSGLWMSELWPNLAKHADDLCMLNSMATDLPAHPQAFTQCDAYLWQRLPSGDLPGHQSGRTDDSRASGGARASFRRRHGPSDGGEH
jgi:hypothetical protein